MTIYVIDFWGGAYQSCRRYVRDGDRYAMYRYTDDVYAGGFVGYVFVDVVKDDVRAGQAVSFIGVREHNYFVVEEA